MGTTSEFHFFVFSRTKFCNQLSKVMVMNDGATILKSLHVDNPAAKVLVGNSSLSEI
jgi:chaperonin GroEL (HSP60 family)